MKANELRIWNWVNIAREDGVGGMDISRIEQISDNDIKLFDDYIIEPIPLTEEWLLKFGFNTDSDCWYYYKDWSSKHDTFKVAKDEFNNFFMVGYHSKSFKHVHQLQNLYFALTNEELTI